MKYDFNMSHRKSLRLEKGDYTRGGIYFVTFCVTNRNCLFGNITNAKMVLNNNGSIAARLLKEISSQFTNAASLESVIMPNHVHALISISAVENHKNNENEKQTTVNNTYTKHNTIFGNHLRQDAMNRAPTFGGFANDKNPMLNQGLSRVVRWYKGRASFEIRKECFAFAWQRNYYEHFIRNIGDYNRISSYIKNNPANWHEDRFFHTNEESHIST